MTRARSRSILFVGWLCLVLLSLRPVEPFERALTTALAPLRVLAELTAPLHWLRQRELVAVERDLAAAQDEEVLEREALERALRGDALPTDPDLRAGRRLVPAEVVGRAPGDLDELLVRVPSAQGGDGGAAVRPGLPVVWGDAYVGRVTALDPLLPELARVRLVTSREFFVGGSVPLAGGGEAQMTVGGLDRAPRDAGEASRADSLGVHNPSDRELGASVAVDPAAPLVVVKELLEGLDASGALAEGYVLGRLVRHGAWLGIEPVVDFRAGLFQVTVLAPGGGEVATPARDVLQDGRWVRARALTSGDPTSWRAGMKIAPGEWEGVTPGAALVHGPRLLGRVSSVGPVSADVALLADPGFELVALARLGRETGTGDHAPPPELHALGRLVSLGPDPADETGGTVLLRWDAVVPLLPQRVAALGPHANGAVDDEGVEAAIFSGSGEAGLPRGLLVGRTRLPLGAPPDGRGHVLRVRTDVDGLDVTELWVRDARLVGADR